MEQFNNQNPSTLFVGKKETPLHADYLTAILAALAMLERHFRRSLDELEKQIYIDGLRELRPEQIERITKKALKTLKRMPLIADLLELANERSEEVKDPRPNAYPPSPLLEEIREIEREISQQMFGKPYHELEGNQLLACATEAAQIRYQRMLGKAKAL